MFMKPVNLVKKLRDFLDFVDDDLRGQRAGRKLCAQHFRILQKATVFFGFEKIDPECVWVGGF